MQLENNHIAIRERAYPDLLDLALLVIRKYAGPLAVAFLCGAVPMMCLNAWLLGDIMEGEFDETAYMNYVASMLMLVIWEMPLATAPITLFLGQALFTNRPGARRIARDFFSSLPQLIWYQVVLRAILVLPIITLFFLFTAWSYLTEVILLERNPVYSGKKGHMTTSRRRRALHDGYGGELFARWLASAAVGAMLVVSFASSCYIMGGVLLNEWESETLVLTVYYPMALWLVVGYSTVVRFLAYIDLRIRREGWEVELMLRAEEQRLARKMA